MPYNDPDPKDPNMLVGVVLPGDREAINEMAYVFAEEFARQGYDKTQLLWLFKNPFYAGAHGAYKALGEEAIRTIIDECLNAWGSVRFWILDCRPTREAKSKIANLKSKMKKRSAKDAQSV